MQHAHWDEYEEAWKIEFLEFAGGRGFGKFSLGDGRDHGGLSVCRLGARPRRLRSPFGANTALTRRRRRGRRRPAPGNAVRAARDQADAARRAAAAAECDLYALDCRRMEGLYFSYASLAGDLAGAGGPIGVSTGAAAAGGAPRRAAQQPASAGPAPRPARPGSAGARPGSGGGAVAGTGRRTTGGAAMSLSAAAALMAASSSAGCAAPPGGANNTPRLGSPAAGGRPASARSRASLLEAAGAGRAELGSSSGRRGGGTPRGADAWIPGLKASGGALGRQEPQQQYPTARGLVSASIDGLSRPASARAAR
jgi:hypothetical protein